MGAHLDGRQQDGVADAVGEVVEAPQLMTHGMDVAQACGVKSCSSQVLRIAAGSSHDSVKGFRACNPTNPKPKSLSPNP